MILCRNQFDGGFHRMRQLPSTSLIRAQQCFNYQ